jgi:hypothetical protein
MPTTAYSLFWGVNPGDYSLYINKAPIRRRAQMNVQADQYRALTALFNGLIGAAVGSNVTATHRRIGHTLTNTEAVERPVVTVTDINRNTVTADVTALKEIVSAFATRPSAYPRDLSGNGGPAL